MSIDSADSILYVGVSLNSLGQMPISCTNPQYEEKQIYIYISKLHPYRFYIM